MLPKGGGAKLTRGRLSKFDAWAALAAQIMKMTERPLQALTLTKKERTCTMAPIMVGSLNGVGACQSLPRAAACAPVKRQGAGAKGPCAAMGAKHVEMIMEDSRWQMNTGGKFRISLEEMKVEAGVGGSTMTQGCQRFRCLATKGIAQHAWELLHGTGMPINDKVGEADLRRAGDQCLTKALYERVARGEALQRVSQCCIFLNVSTVTDITTGDGRHIACSMR